MPQNPASPVRVRFETPFGVMDAEIDVLRAPITAGNFLSYIDDGAFDGIPFYRAIRRDNDVRNEGIRIVQAGLAAIDHPRRFAPIAHESTDVTGLRHVAGTLSMGRYDPGTASSEFFIVLEDAPQLDARGHVSGDNLGYAAFGKIVRGLDVARKINEGATGDTPGVEFMRAQALLTPINVRVRRA
ncbi:MAG TPA: peptidylprolyl isomerase [Verrucomicrobiae bacterium]|jgi:peptidyl-prolyl cis-trans isomerase A (cyclophilin A)|nr:peptidylprolyl isomerase [Verrucomicrobiae bacterium]